MEDTGAVFGKFEHPYVTAKGETRASVALTGLQTLWFNTGTLCNITCVNCYIESSPTNDALVYLTLADVQAYLDEIARDGLPVREIGFTGGEPFMNPQMIAMTRAALTAGFRVLILTNAMRPMMRPAMRDGLAALNREFPGQMVLRVSLDHWNAAEHDAVRGAGAFALTLAGMDWLRDAGLRMAVAGRMLWGEAEDQARAAYGRLYAERGYDIDAADPGQTVLFPEMDGKDDVPEITTACWGILNKSPKAVMCASSRMVVRRKGADAPAVIACTLLPYEAEFELGETLADAAGPVQLTIRIARNSAFWAVPAVRAEPVNAAA